MKMDRVMLIPVMLMGMSCVEGGPPRMQLTLKDIQQVLNSVEDFLVKTYDAAKEDFNKLVSNVDFNATVYSLIPYIHSGMTVAACADICVGAASSVLGPLVNFANTVCRPLCDGALAELEDLAG